MRLYVQLGLQTVRYLHICAVLAVAANSLPTNKYCIVLNIIPGYCRGYLLPTFGPCSNAIMPCRPCTMYILQFVCICGLLLEKGLQVSNLIEIIPLKWTLVQHSCFVNPISCIQSIDAMQNANEPNKKEGRNKQKTLNRPFFCFTMSFNGRIYGVASAFKGSKLQLQSNISIGVILNLYHRPR